MLIACHVCISESPTMNPVVPTRHLPCYMVPSLVTLTFSMPEAIYSSLAAYWKEWMARPSLQLPPLSACIWSSAWMRCLPRIQTTLRMSRRRTNLPETSRLSQSSVHLSILNTLRAGMLRQMCNLVSVWMLKCPPKSPELSRRLVWQKVWSCMQLSAEVLSLQEGTCPENLVCLWPWR